MSGPKESTQMVSEINVTPLVDVMLVLLIIFMVAAPLTTTGVPVVLPKGETQTLDSEDAKIILTIPATFPKDQVVYLGKNPVRVVDLTLKLRTNDKLQTEREMYIHADGSLRYQDVISVMSLVSKAGADKVGLITDPISSREETGP
ncbi:MAG TPA: biopolymer transporter ExbD [Pseudomonadota bacterium]|nr:biopolymer transporter ExbD [Pseudomonadota bacterium]HMU39740.1 biopolymer transporter ExbD [Pseudomonadota bacterium]